MQIALRPPIRLETDEDLVRVSRDNPGYTFEREEDGTIIVSPTSTDGGGKSMEASGQLRDYAKLAGGKTYDSNTGFGVGPGERVLSPDAAWLSQARIDALGPAERKTFWAISPDVVIEVASDSIRSRRSFERSRSSSNAAAPTPWRSTREPERCANSVLPRRASASISTRSSTHDPSAPRIPALGTAQPARFLRGAVIPKGPQAPGAKGPR